MNSISASSRTTGSAGQLERKSRTDAELLAIDLQIDDPRALPNLSATPPDPDWVLQLAGEYHLHKNDPGLRCSYCPTHTIHRNGFVLAREDAHYVLGSTCGPKHFGLSFNASKRELNEQKDRQSFLRRLRAIAAHSDDLIAAYNAILFSSGLRALDAARKELAQASPNLAADLRGSVNAGFALYEFVKIRDFRAEANRPDDSKAPIYTEDRQSLGNLEGTALVSTPDPRTIIHKAKAAILHVTTFIKADTNGHLTSRLRAEYRTIEELHSEAQRTVVDCNAAHLFFSTRNRERLARWSDRRPLDKFIEASSAIIVQNKKGRHQLQPIEPLNLPRLPALPV